MNYQRLNNTDLFLLDMDGTIYLDDAAIVGAVEAVKHIKDSGKKVCYLTNNSSKSRNEYLKKLNTLGFSASLNEIITSGVVTADYIIKHYPNKSVYLFGTPALKTEFQNMGVKLTENNPDIVIMGFHTEFTYQELDTLCSFVRQGVTFFATHPDKNCPTKDGFMPDVGSFLSLVFTSTQKRPSKIFGKPYKYMVQYLKNKFDVNIQNMAMTGDRLSTDIKFGNKFGILSVLVLSGETDQKMLESSKVQPDIVLPSIKEYIKIIS